jgi:TetR/AcrR family transcriptional repressor of nem operon
MDAVHAGLDACLSATDRPPLDRIRCFFEATQDDYRQQGYLGCLMGGLGQELSGVNEVFRLKIESCFSQIAERLTSGLTEAQAHGELPPDFDVREMANVLVNCWEGAALRSRLRREAAPLTTMLDFYLRSVEAH